MISRLRQMESQAKYGKRFAKQCKDDEEYLFYEQLENILHQTINRILIIKKLTDENEK